MNSSVTNIATDVTMVDCLIECHSVGLHWPVTSYILPGCTIRTDMRHFCRALHCSTSANRHASSVAQLSMVDPPPPPPLAAPAPVPSPWLTSCSLVVPHCCICHLATLSYKLGMTGDGTFAVLLLLLLVLDALQLPSARSRKSCSGAEATVSPATMATTWRPSCSMACLAARRAATLRGDEEQIQAQLIANSTKKEQVPCLLPLHWQKKSLEPLNQWLLMPVWHVRSGVHHSRSEACKCLTAEHTDLRSCSPNVHCAH
jgi:hypothetical protein